MTEIQVAALPHALAGRDILGAARTGSGKTLAFLIPLLEELFRRRWTFTDGLGALVVSPTRELALQIFEVLRVVGKQHAMSAGLITGGKKEFREEQQRIVRMNILVATPGRLLQHLEQTPGFDVSQLQVLVLDEADRILDLGFREQLNGVLSYLPSERQTLLFSATQTKSVKDLARLSLNRVATEYVAVRHGAEDSATPTKLVQNYVVCALPDKLDVLFSFLKTHLKSKVVVFFNSCAQVRFVHALLCELQPGMPLLALHGKCKQGRRTEVYMDFVRRPAAVLFATDVAARGLDFPAVDWVIQADAPEDAAAYIHRVGRTARYKSSGRGLLLLLPSEEAGIAAALAEKKVPIRRLTVNPERMRLAGSVTKRAAAAVAADPEKRRLAQKAFGSYVRSIQLMPDKATFRADALQLQEFARSLGLPTAPKVPTLPAPALPAGSAAAGAGGKGNGAPSAGAVAIAVMEAGEEGREALRQKKNMSRSLLRLKEQIRLEKLQRRLERVGTSGMPVAAAGAIAAVGAKGAPAGTTAEAPLCKPVASKGPTAAAAAAANGNDEDSDDDLLVVKARYDAGAAATDVGANYASAGDIDEAELGRTRKRRKPEKMRITQDGVAVAAVAAGATRVVFDEDGDAMVPVAPLQRFVEVVALAASGEGGTAAGASAAADCDAGDDVRTASAAYIEKVKARLQAAAAADKARERQRVREKHVKRRLKDRAPRTDMEHRLGLGADGVSDTGASSNGEGSYAGGRDSGDGSDSGSDGGSDDGSDDGGSDRKGAIASCRGRPSRRIAAGLSDEVSDSDQDAYARGNGGKGTARRGEGRSASNVAAEEEAVLRLLQRQR